MLHIVESQQFTRDWLEGAFFPVAEEMAKATRFGEGLDILKGKRMIALFYEPSTRTRLSFETAMYMLGGVVMSTENAKEFSSAVKGETLADTIEVLNRYWPHVIVIRHHETDSVKKVADLSTRAHIINAGDGRGQHPTQALLDLFTIRNRFHRVDGIKVAMVGDLKNGRTIRSLSYLLGKYEGVEIVFVSPESLRVGEDIKESLAKHGVKFAESDDLAAVAPTVDVVYQTRVQKERGGDMDNETVARFMIDRNILQIMRTNSIIMHPLPRNAEIATEVDANHRAVYKTDQIDSGLHTRMALLKLLLT